MTTPESVIEIGSTGVRLLVAELTYENGERKQNVLDRSEKPLPMGRDVFTSGIISKETQSQLIQILRLYREQLSGWGISPQQTYCFATNAFRVAKNSDPVLDRILVQTGFRVSLIDGIEENKLMYLAVTETIKTSPINNDFKNENSIILNVGGSTTEIMLISDGKMAGVHSLKIGTIRIEQHIKTKTTSYSEIQRYIEESINNTKGSLESELNLGKVTKFIAVGQDVTLAALLVGRPVSTFLWEINKIDFNSFVQEMQKYSVDEIVARFKISYNEAENLQVSLLIYNLFFHLTKAETMYVPETNIRNGYLIAKSSTNNELQQEYNTQIVASAKNLLRKYHGDVEHAECVRMIATKIFDTLKEEVALDDRSRVLLETAAVLHDIGVFIRYDNHNLHSYYIIKNSEIFGLSKMENTIVAEIAKYHKGDIMPQDNESFFMYQRTDRMKILKLTAILRISDALDRGHTQKFNDFSIKIEKNNIIIHAKNSKNTVLEKIALVEKADMFESIFGYRLILL